MLIEEFFHNNTVIADVAWDFIIRVAFVFCAALYAVVTRNKSEDDGIIEKLDTFAIGLFIIGAFPVLAVVGIYKGISPLIKSRNEKRCFRHRTEGSFVHSFKVFLREDNHLMVNKYESFVEYFWNKQNGFSQKEISVGYEKPFMDSKTGWTEIYRKESIDCNLDDVVEHETDRSFRYKIKTG